ncbi:MAG: LemA family protein [Flavobacteriales bacterium]|nr:LemA family protein [Flavobacteriales bacterium]
MGGGLFLGLIILAVIVVGWGVSVYNGLVSEDESVKNKWSKVESAYQRRADLIPNLVNTVKGYADFEKETLTQVIEARAKATQMTVDPTKLTPEVMAQFQQNQDGLSTALGRLLVAVERYPDLKANQNFLQLQNQLEGTENRIKIERDAFNDAVNKYNAMVRKTPNNLIAGFLGFDVKGNFTAKAGSENAPTVEF